MGLRYDYQRIAKPPITNPNAALLAAGFDTGFQPKYKNNFAPRFGLSFAFNEKTVVRGGYGLYYGRTPAILHRDVHPGNVIVDRAGRLQIPQAYIDSLGMEDRARVRLLQDHIGVWPIAEKVKEG